MWKYISKKSIGGITFGITTGIIFTVVLWVQAVAPGAVVNPVFGPQDNDVTSFCHWEISDHRATCPHNLPCISVAAVSNQKATGRCKCSDIADPYVAITTLVPLDSTNSGGFLELNTQAPDNWDYWTCDNDTIANGCNAGVSDYFAYLACG